ncbi:MAG: toll/interleukin-1 receptor domain-containing protein [bacterium]|nr:toll/interleukin-1 receptor domain-containing protein [bacterium]
MPNTVFISYSHRQGDWVWNRLVSCLRAGGAEVLIDRERFEAGHSVIGMMDSVQDSADKHLLVLSPEYLESSFCVHEMDRAITNGIAVPVLRSACELPDAICRTVSVDLRDDSNPEPWNRLMDACGASLGTFAPVWISARDEAHRFLERGQSVSLVTGLGVAWRQLIATLCEGITSGLATVDLERPAVFSRRGLVAETLRGLGAKAPVPAEPEDLAVLERVLEARDRSFYLVLVHFDSITRYDVDLFRALRYLVMDSRKMVLLTQSRSPFATLLPNDHPLSEIDVKTVELPARHESSMS